MISLLGFIGLGGVEVIYLLGIIGVLFILPIMALVDILQSRFIEPNNKLIWVIVVLCLNIIGAILYYIIGRKQRMT